MKMPSFENAPTSQKETKTELEAKKTELKHVETKNGLPVMDAAEYDRFYNTDIREFGEDIAATFDFQGYVRYEEEGKQKELYKDVFATNGLLKEIGGEGIHVGTDGIRDYDTPSRGTGPENIGEYDVYIKIPPEIQKAKDVYCMFDDCRSVENAPDYVEKDELEHAQGQVGWIVIRTVLEPERDKLAREKARAIHLAIVKHIEDGGRLDQIKNLVYQMEDKLKGMDEANLKRQMRMLESGKKELPE